MLGAELERTVKTATGVPSTPEETHAGDIAAGAVGGASALIPFPGMQTVPAWARIAERGIQSAAIAGGTLIADRLAREKRLPTMEEFETALGLGGGLGTAGGVAERVANPPPASVGEPSTYVQRQVNPSGTTREAAGAGLQEPGAPRAAPILQQHLRTWESPYRQAFNDVVTDASSGGIGLTPGTPEHTAVMTHVTGLEGNPVPARVKPILAEIRQAVVPPTAKPESTGVLDANGQPIMRPAAATTPPTVPYGQLEDWYQRLDKAMPPGSGDYYSDAQALKQSIRQAQADILPPPLRQRFDQATSDWKTQVQPVRDTVHQIIDAPTGERAMQIVFGSPKDAEPLTRLLKVTSPELGAQVKDAVSQTLVDSAKLRAGIDPAGRVPGGDESAFLRTFPAVVRRVNPAIRDLVNPKLDLLATALERAAAKGPRFDLGKTAATTINHAVGMALGEHLGGPVGAAVGYAAPSIWTRLLRAVSPDPTAAQLLARAVMTPAGTPAARELLSAFQRTSAWTGVTAATTQPPAPDEESEGG